MAKNLILTIFYLQFKSFTNAFLDFYDNLYIILS